MCTHGHRAWNNSYWRLGSVGRGWRMKNYLISTMYNYSDNGYTKSQTLPGCNVSTYLRNETAFAPLELIQIKNKNI